MPQSAVLTPNYRIPPAALLDLPEPGSHAQGANSGTTEPTVARAGTSKLSAL